MDLNLASPYPLNTMKRDQRANAVLNRCKLWKKERQTSKKRTKNEIGRGKENMGGVR
jgi:hypothetical protein